jgi:hypothetical protein
MAFSVLSMRGCILTMACMFKPKFHILKVHQQGIPNLVHETVFLLVIKVHNI